MLAACMYRMSDARRRLFLSMRKARGLQCNNHVVVNDGYMPMFRNRTVGQAQGVEGPLGVGFMPNSGIRMYVLCIQSDVCIQSLQYMFLPRIHQDISLLLTLQIRKILPGFQFDSFILSSCHLIILSSCHLFIFPSFHSRFAKFPEGRSARSNSSLHTRGADPAPPRTVWLMKFRGNVRLSCYDATSRLRCATGPRKERNEIIRLTPKERERGREKLTQQ